MCPFPPQFLASDPKGQEAPFGWSICSYPIKEVDGYIQRIVEAGFEDRVMFGTDQMVWPKLIETSIGVIDRASYLTPQQKRDILYNNAARFLRLNKGNGAASAR